MHYRYANAANHGDAAQSTRGDAAQDQPYPDTRQLVDALRAQTPPELQYLVDDGFERIVLYDNKALSATDLKRADGNGWGNSRWSWTASRRAPASIPTTS